MSALANRPSLPASATDPYLSTSHYHRTLPKYFGLFQERSCSYLQETSLGNLVNYLHQLSSWHICYGIPSFLSVFLKSSYSFIISLPPGKTTFGDTFALVFLPERVYYSIEPLLSNPISSSTPFTTTRDISALAIAILELLQRHRVCPRS